MNRSNDKGRPYSEYGDRLPSSISSILCNAGIADTKTAVRKEMLDGGKLSASEWFKRRHLGRTGYNFLRRWVGLSELPQRRMTPFDCPHCGKRIT